MKRTGIIRRVDELGRIVIPKELRKTLHLREGDPMEIFIEDGAVVFVPFSDLENCSRLIAECLRALDEVFCVGAVVCDLEKVVAASPALKDTVGARIQGELRERINAGVLYEIGESPEEYVLVQRMARTVQVMLPIILNDMPVGAVITVQDGRTEVGLEERTRFARLVVSTLAGYLKD